MITREEIETLDDEALARRVREHKDEEYAELRRQVEGNVNSGTSGKCEE